MTQPYQIAERPDVLQEIARVARQRGITPLQLQSREFQTCKAAPVKVSRLVPWEDWQREAMEYYEAPDAEILEHPEDGVPDEIDLTKIIARRREDFTNRADRREAQKSYRIKVRELLPIGVCFFGDPHLDDTGSDLDLLLEHAKIVRQTRGMFGASIGDATNNWCGRLSRLYAEQTTTASEGFALAEHFIREVRDWMFLIKGNHDVWHGAGRDPLEWFAKQTRAPYTHEIRIILEFPNGREVTIQARHNFRGHSMWNPSHGTIRQVRMAGYNDDILVNGHTHVTGYTPIVAPGASKKIMHCLQVGSYKRYDDYQEAEGFADYNWSPCATAIIDPLAESVTGRVQVIWEPKAAASYLGYLRSGRTGSVIEQIETARENNGRKPIRHKKAA